MKVIVAFEVEIDKEEYPDAKTWFEAMIQDHLGNWDQEAVNIELLEVES